MLGLRCGRVSALETLALRHSVLRAGRPLSTCFWEDDNLPTTHHYAILSDRETIGIASIYQRDLPGEHVGCGQSWQLRGMAVHPERQGQGLGSVLLKYVLDDCAGPLSGAMMWCNARVRAVSFYERHGFEAIGEPFEVAGIGPHFLMRKQLS